MRLELFLFIISASVSASQTSALCGPSAIQDATVPRVILKSEPPLSTLAPRAKRPKRPKGIGDKSDDCTATITTMVGGQQVTTLSVYHDDDCTLASTKENVVAQSATSLNSKAGAIMMAENRAGGMQELVVAALLGALAWV